MDGALRRAFQRFVDAVAERLDLGERIYKGSALTQPLAELGCELERRPRISPAGHSGCWCVRRGCAKTSSASSGHYERARLYE